MASSGNFAVFNPLANTQAGLSYAGAVYSNANTRFRGNTGGTATTQLTHGLPSGKWYIEFFVDGNPASGFPMIGIVASGLNSTTLQNTSNAPALNITSDIQLVSGERRVFGSTSGDTDYGSSFSDEDICQMAIDVDNGKVWWGKNNTWFNSGDPAAGSNAGDTFTALTEMMVFVGSYSGAAYIIVNAGQDDTFSGEVTAAGNADGNGFGAFKYSPPSGFLAICSANIPTAADIDPAETDDDIPTKQFGVLTFTGNGTARTISGLGFQPDLIWSKRRSGTGKRHYLVDSVRGFTSYLHTDQAVSEGTSTDGVTSATSDGFAIGGSLDYINENTSTYVAWCWRAGGTSSTNTSGTITSTVSANQNAGFSIVKWRSNNSANQTIGHGLSKAPRFIISKPYSASTWSWHNFHHYQGSIGKFNFANNSTGAFGSGTNTYGAMPSTTVFTVGTAGNLMPNNSTTDVISYCWHDVDGLQKFGSYTGNGNADGPFIYLGFRPRLFVQKRADSTGAWRVWDSERHSFNPNDAIFRWGTDGAEDTANGVVDFLSNGVKIRMTYAEMNASTGTFVYMAWADVPFKYGNTF